jgi:hypothetical protein
VHGKSVLGGWTLLSVLCREVAGWCADLGVSVAARVQIVTNSATFEWRIFAGGDGLAGSLREVRFSSRPLDSLFPPILVIKESRRINTSKTRC